MHRAELVHIDDKSCRQKEAEDHEALRSAKAAPARQRKAGE
jgi:hypothetical protein